MKKIERLSMYFDELKETMPLDKLKVYVNENIRNIVEHSYNKAPSVKRIMDNIGFVPKNINDTEDLLKFPILKKTT